MNAFPQPKEYDPKCFRRSKSMSSLSDDINFYKIHKEHSFCCQSRHSHTISESSVECFVVVDSDSETSVDGRNVQGTLSCGGEVLSTLERKIDRLSDLFEEQCRLLSAIKDEVQESKDAIENSGYAHTQVLAEVVRRSISTRRMKELVQCESDEAESTNARAKSLLNAIEAKRAGSLDAHVRDALTAFLQSDELRERMVSATASSVRDVVRGCVSRDLSAAYLPVLQSAHRRLLRHVSRTLDLAFAELEENSSALSRHMYRTSRSLRRALERRQDLLDAGSLRNTVEELLDKELKQWRQKVLDIIVAELQSDYEEYSEPSIEPLDYPLSPVSPPQPADPEQSIIDQLMTSAEINKQIQDGDVNGSFERALSASDLSLVMVACRAADPASLFAPPCRLTQSVLLSLAQQLATDMVHETQLKCRYLEDTIISLNTSNPATRAHLPLVVGEVRKHLMKFLLSYPNHVASRRVNLIVMAADNLLKQCN
ncbi:hypothetical protein ABMA28_013241 [Loxostege sticticalis]|uniref:Enhancer of mRNA-decapping protein 4 C-terminal domain-containing protein n=1 Tax=Loxostege sticticalis TaxID=481309 RepID=A0ABD0THK8_LOXSC